MKWWAVNFRKNEVCKICISYNWIVVNNRHVLLLKMVGLFYFNRSG